MQHNRSPWVSFRGSVLISTITISLVLIAGSSPAAAPPGYYSSVVTDDAASLRITLHEVIDDHTRYPYTASTTDTWDILNLADEDPASSSRILDLYKNASYTKISGGTGVYNREHSWPKSYGFPNDGSSNYPYTDCHHLFAADTAYNADRGSKPFRYCHSACQELPTDYNNGEGGGSGVYPGQSNWAEGAYAEGTWETWAGRRGDVARALFYMAIRYEGGTHGITGYSEPDLELTDNQWLIESSATGSNESVAYMGMLSDLLAWHLEDPVDDRERARNDVVYSFQGNRNPFVDHPEWVACVFTGSCSGGGGTGTGTVVLSEVFYDPSGTDTGLEWVELYNAGDGPVDLSGYSLGNGGTSYTYSTVQLSGTIQAGATFVVGGPVSNGYNGYPTYDQAVDFNPDFQNSGTTADGVALFAVPAAQISGSTVPVDAVVYGGANSSGLIDETGSAAAPEVGDAPSGYSIERTDLSGTWRMQSSPTPNTSALAGSNTPAVVSILTPGNGSSASHGSLVSFSATANDSQDGDLSGSLSWSSSIDGSIGWGASFSTAALSVGSHTITASVVDSGGLTGSDSISLTISAVGGAATVVLSEVFYDPSGYDTNLEWIELYNYGDSAVDLSGFSIGAGGTSYTYSKLQLSGTIPAHSTFVVGGPSSTSLNYYPSFDQAVDFNPDIQNSGSTADGVALFDRPASEVSGSTVPIDAVVYGGSNASQLIDETGSASSPEVGDAPSGASIERTSLAGTWQIQYSPSPGIIAF